MPLVQPSTLSGFVFSGALAGLAGGLHVLLLHGARAGSYQVVQSVEGYWGLYRADGSEKPALQVMRDIGDALPQ